MATEPTEDAAAPGALALAQLADDVARALSSYAAALRRGGVHAPAPGSATSADTPTTAAKPAALGERQQRLLALRELDSPAGLSNRAIAELLGINAPNATALTKRLHALGHLVVVPGESPLHYRRAASVPTSGRVLAPLNAAGEGGSTAVASRRRQP